MAIRLHHGLRNRHHRLPPHRQHHDCPLILSERVEYSSVDDLVVHAGQFTRAVNLNGCAQSSAIVYGVS